MDKEFLKKCWKNPRWHSLMVLIIWIVSLSVLMGIVSIINQFSTPKETIQKEPVQESNHKFFYEEMWKLFETNDYAFTYTISKNGEVIKYEGNVKEGKTTGYRERNDGIIKYEIENNKHFQVLVDEKIEITNLYENVEESFLNPFSIYEKIKAIPIEDTDIIEEKEKTIYKYSTLIEEEKINICIITSETKIKNITIEKTNETYQLDFEE